MSYRPKETPGFYEWWLENGPFSDGHTPGVSPLTTDEGNTCRVYRQTTHAHILCAWNEDIRGVQLAIEAQEKQKEEEDPAYTKKIVSHTVCEYHRKIFHDTFKNGE